MRKPKTIENHPYVLVSLPIDIQSIHMVLDRWFACWIRNMRKRRNKRWLVTDMENTIQQLLRFE